MTIMHKFRLLPLLVIVAFLSLSVRTLDFISGTSSYFSEAKAVENEEEPEKVPVDETDLDLLAEGSENIEELDGVEPPTDPLGPKDPAYDWRDSSEIDMDYSDVKVQLFNDLKVRRERLDKKEKVMMQREALLRASEKELDRKFEELTKIKGELNELLNVQSQEEEKRIRSLVKVYENMKPKDAARIFDTLDIQILVDVTSRMSERKLSPVMAQMNPERAKTVTVFLAEQKSLPTLP